MKLLKYIPIALSPHIPIIITRISEYFRIGKLKKNYTKRTLDKSLFTQGMYDFATEAYQNYSINKINQQGNIRTQRHLTTFLNEVFGTNKSTAAMSRLFKGEIPRDSLAVGHSYFPTEEKEVIL